MTHRAGGQADCHPSDQRKEAKAAHLRPTAQRTIGSVRVAPIRANLLLRGPLAPRNILADTGPLFALIHAGDADYARAVEFARSFAGRLITSWPFLTEVAYLLVKSNRRGIGTLLGMILGGHLSVSDLDS